MKKIELPKMTTTGKIRESVILFFDSIIERRFSDADKALTEVKEKKNINPDFKEGYVKALEGMLTSAKSGDDREFYNKAIYDKENLLKYSQDFKELIQKGVHSPFDAGYFSAWSDFIHYRISFLKE
ncbi:hypothetical protein JW865_04415 [Candidatus Bathyarchaeota archaeon]|nr:hypothetical protein [Candidatus Bathyarchaeota archaeon]